MPARKTSASRKPVASKKPAKAAAAGKVDLKKDLKELYSGRAGKSVLVKVPALSILAVDGKGHPSSGDAFGDAMAALYAVAYGIKFARKEAGKGSDFTVMPPEALWWAARNRKLDGATALADYRWSLFLVVPKFVREPAIRAARDAAKAKKDGPKLAAKVELRKLTEGRCVQTLHVGPYDAEGPTIAAMHAFAAEQGLKPTGKHHEIYLSDPRKAAPDKLRTILRQPVA